MGVVTASKYEETKPVQTEGMLGSRSSFTHVTYRLEEGPECEGAVSLWFLSPSFAPK